MKKLEKQIYAAFIVTVISTLMLLQPCSNPSSALCSSQRIDWCSFSVALTDQTIKINDKNRLRLVILPHISAAAATAAPKTMAAAAATTAVQTAAQGAATTSLDPEGSLRLLGPKSSNPLVRYRILNSLNNNKLPVCTGILLKHCTVRTVRTYLTLHVSIFYCVNCAIQRCSMQQSRCEVRNL